MKLYWVRVNRNMFHNTFAASCRYRAVGDEEWSEPCDMEMGHFEAGQEYMAGFDDISKFKHPKAIVLGEMEGS